MFSGIRHCFRGVQHFGLAILSGLSTAISSYIILFAFYLKTDLLRSKHWRPWWLSLKYLLNLNSLSFLKTFLLAGFCLKLHTRYKRVLCSLVCVFKIWDVFYLLSVSQRLSRYIWQNRCTLWLCWVIFSQYFCNYNLVCCSIPRNFS